MVFKFNFDPVGKDSDPVSVTEQHSQKPMARCPAVEVLPSTLPAASPEASMEEVQVAPGLMLYKGRVDSSEAAGLLGNPQLTESDLVPGQYEGGFKLWEGALDLCQYLIQRYGLQHLCRDSSSSSAAAAGGEASSSGSSSLQGKAVIELGCGHGLPGIVAALGGASKVHFQDYNREVLATLTIPNVHANLAARQQAGSAAASSRYWAGDWLSVGELLISHGLGAHYDVLLAAETIYSEASQEDLLECIKQVLQPPHGIALVAAKSYYFGVGGGTATFAERVRRDGILEVRSVWASGDGDGSVKREVLELKFPDSIAPYFL